jgi:hypothetical protein
VSDESAKAFGPTLELLKARFNRAIAPLLAQMAIVEKSLADDRESYATTRAEHEQIAAGLSADNTVVHLKDEKRAVARTAGGGATAAPAATAAAGAKPATAPATAVKTEPGKPPAPAPTAYVHPSRFARLSLV